MGNRIPSDQWLESGHDYVIDGLWGRLGFQETVGETLISGATNGLAAVEDPRNGNTFLYAGAANGGLYLRIYDIEKSKWLNQWQWLTKPGSFYEGSQGIAIIEPSDDGQYLAVGQGNSSNYAGVSAPSKGVQVGRILSDGRLSWLPLSEASQAKLNGLDVRSLVWEGDLLRGTAWDPRTESGSRFSLLVDEGRILDAQVDNVGSLNLVSDGSAQNFLEAGYNDQTGVNQVSLNGSPLNGSEYQELINSFLVNGDRIARVSVYPELVDGKEIVFIGSYLPEGDEPIFRVLRLQINPSTGELISYRSTTAVVDGQPYAPFGSAQGANNGLYYGNFSFQVDPYDPEAQSIYVGGNQYSQSLLSPSYLYVGGLVKADFRTDEPTLTPLYGPRIEGDLDQQLRKEGKLILPFNPGAPHADSRSIAFFNSRDGIKLLQTDDGGVWELAQDPVATGLVMSSDAWWRSLSAPGMATLELNQADWNSKHNLIISSYQDNASSIGIYGESYASNIGVGDGQLALFDDADPDSVRGYTGSQFYYKTGEIISVNYDKNGFVKNISYPEFFLQDPESQRLLPWDETSEASFKPGQFILPVDTNPFRSGSLVQTGYTNVYEQIGAGRFGDVALVFRPLLPQASSGQLQPTALDTQSPVSRELLPSIYVGATIANNQVTLLGRNSGGDFNDYQLKPLGFSNLDSESLTSSGQVVDVTHMPGQGSEDLIFWLQGGKSLAYGLRTAPTVSSSQQVLRFGRNGGSVTTLPLEEIGLPLVPGDQYGYQALQYIPQTDNHAALLLISGLTGVWSSELSDDGVPLGFTPMPWQQLPDSGPGAYIRSLKYDPTDDLLIAASQGKGSYLYSFSGEIGQRRPDNEILNVSDLTLPLLSDPRLDKRRNEVNALISIALEGQLLDQEQPTQIIIKLHDVAAWRRAMEFVSPYNFNVKGAFDFDFRDFPATDQVFRINNVLDPIGLRNQGGERRAGNISFPVEIAAGATLFNLQVNTKDREVLRAIKPLNYSVRLVGTNERVDRTLTFEFPPLSDLESQGEPRALQFQDEITGLGADKASRLATALQAADLSEPVNTSASVDSAPIEACDGVRALCFATPSSLSDPGFQDQRSIPMLMNDSNLFVQNSPLL